MANPTPQSIIVTTTLPPTLQRYRDAVLRATSFSQNVEVQGTNMLYFLLKTELAPVFSWLLAPGSTIDSLNLFVERKPVHEAFNFLLPRDAIRTRALAEAETLSINPALLRLIERYTDETSPRHYVATACGLVILTSVTLGPINLER